MIRSWTASRAGPRGAGRVGLPARPRRRPAAARWSLCQMLLLNRSPHLEDMSTELFERAAASASGSGGDRGRTRCTPCSGPSPSSGFCRPAAARRTTPRACRHRAARPQAWAELGRALARHVDAHARRSAAPSAPSCSRSGGGWPPSIPSRRPRQLDAADLRGLDRRAGPDERRRLRRSARVGLERPRRASRWRPSARRPATSPWRTFFRDCQEWEWIPRRFDPPRALATPRSIAALLGPDPRVIADEVWAKLLWAGLNLEPTTCPSARPGTFYPLELVRAVTLTWLFSGQRSDEIARLRVGCIRWQHDGADIRGDDRRGPGPRRGLPAGRAHPQDRHRVHQAGRPAHGPGHRGLAGGPPRPAEDDRPQDRRAGRLAVRLPGPARRQAPTSTARSSRCSAARPASRPPTSAGNITSHRARSTIASQLYNAKEPMTLFELQAWLGHRSPQSTQHYAKITPTTLTRAYQRRRLLRPQRPHHRGPRRPRRRRLRRRPLGRAVAALRPRPRLLHLHLLRAVPAPHGLRQVRLLHPEGLQQGPAPGGQGEPAAHAGRDPAHRRRTRRRRRRPGPPSTDCWTAWPTSRRPPARRHGSSTGPVRGCRSCRSFPGRGTTAIAE